MLRKIAIELILLAIAVGLTVEVIKPAIPYLPLIWMIVFAHYTWEAATTERALVSFQRLKAKWSGKKSMYSYGIVALLGAGLFGLYWWGLTSFFAPKIATYKSEQNRKLLEGNKRADSDDDKTALFLDCTYEEFPIRISSGSVIHVLRIHPAVIKSSPEAVAFLDVGSPDKKDRTWPLDREAPPLPAFMSTGEPVRHALVMKCTVRKYGKGTVEKALISLQLKGRYNLLIDPLESSGAFESFSFYLLNACYTDLKPGEYDGAGGMSSPIVGTFPEKAKLQLLGESYWKEVPLTVSYRENSMYRTIFLLPVHRRWRDLPPC